MKVKTDAVLNFNRVL